MGKSRKEVNRQTMFPLNPWQPPRPPGGGFPPPPPGGYPDPGMTPTQPPYPGSFPGGQQPGQPPTPPPSFVPQQPQSLGLQAVAPGSLRMCLFRWTYVWLSNGEQFWIWPFSIRQRTVSFYRYIPYFGYTVGGLDTRRIDSFVCNIY